MGNPRCKWVRDRLPLLAGDDLRGLDRRKVERHLIGCPQCQLQRASLDRALGVLHAVSAESPTRSEAPSLWPELARQIRESRPPARTASFGFGVSGFWPRRFERGAVLALGLGTLGVAIAVLVTLGGVGTRRPMADTGREPVVRAPQAPAAPVVTLVEVPAPEEAPAPILEPARSRGEANEADESVPSSRVGYDLDHTMPMGGAEGRAEGKQSTF